MKAFLIAATLAAASTYVTSPAMAQSVQRSYQAYGIIDVQTAVAKDPIIIGVEGAVRRYATDLQSNRPIMVPTPTEPRRFVLSSPLSQQNLGPLAGLAAMAGVSADQLQVPTCEGAVWTGFAQRNVTGHQTLRVWLCLFPYANSDRRGFQLNYYAQDHAEAGGPIGSRIGRSINQRILGTPREWTERMIRSAVAALEDTAGVQGVLIEGEPEVPNLFRHSNSANTPSAPSPE